MKKIIALIAIAFALSACGSARPPVQDNPNYDLDWFVVNDNGKTFRCANFGFESDSRSMSVWCYEITDSSTTTWPQR